MERFKSSLEVLQINIGQKLLPLLTPVIEKVNQFIDWLSKAPPAVQSLAVGIGGFGSRISFIELSRQWCDGS